MYINLVTGRKVSPKISLFILIFLLLSAKNIFAQDPARLVKDAIDYWRDSSSYMEAEMKIHRPEWERTASLKSWTKGTDKSLVRFTAPSKDAGNASLTVGDEVWSYSPKVNRVIKIPASMMSQSWMGSDFSYDDLSKSDDIISEYSHKLIGQEIVDGMKVYQIESTPHPTAAVVWGREVLKVREDKVMLERLFYDQEGNLVKRMLAQNLKNSNGKIYAERVVMEKIDPPGEWTEVIHTKVQFGIPVPESTFTQSNLSNPR